MKYSRIIESSKLLLELGAPIEAFLRDVQIIHEYYSYAENTKELDKGVLGKLRVQLCEKYFIGDSTVNQALYGPKLKKVRCKIIREIRRDKKRFPKAIDNE